MNRLLNTRNEELQKSNLELGRANTKIANANTLVNNLNKQILDEIKKREAVLSLYAALEARLEAERTKVKVLTKVVYRDRTVDRIVDFPKGKIFIRLDDGTYKEVTSMKYNYNDFRIGIEGDAVQETLSYKLHQRFRATFVESRAPGGLINHYAEFWELDDKGRDVNKLTLTKFDVVKSEDLPSKMRWWNPKLDLHIGAGINLKPQFTVVADLGFSISAWGKTADDITWRFFRIGTGYSSTNNFSLTFSPVQFNIGKYIPLVSNIWVTPFGGYSWGQTPGPQFGVGIGVVF